MKWPFLKFYTRDWLSDFELRMCSLEARGFWFECLCLMHCAKRRGYMETPQGQPLNDDQTARLIGTSKGDVLRLREELLEHGVPSVEEETGIMYCRRMVKDNNKALKCSEAGKKNGGSPLLRKNKENIIKKNPEARSHISLEVTFKGRISDLHATMIEDVLNCRPEFANVKQEALLTAIHKAGKNPRLMENHKEFIADMANEMKPPNNPPKKYNGYLQSDGFASRKNPGTVRRNVSKL